MESGHDEKSSLPNTSFVDRRVNDTTFLIIEDDEYSEQPHIYVKICAEYLVISDTGCNAPRHKSRSLTILRKYLETYPLPSNKHQCLNPNGEKKYMIICSHCHYDHILGLIPFRSVDPVIVASCFDKDFVLKDLPEHSLCKYMDVPTPQYKISHWARHLETLSICEKPLGIQFLHTPGHTPDSLAWYDMDEHHLYVGDTFYERKRSKSIPELEDDPAQLQQANQEMQDAIIFPSEGGDWIQFMPSLEALLSFVQGNNERLGSDSDGSELAPVVRVKVSCGHMTFGADAERMIIDIQAFFMKIIAGKVAPSRSFEKRGVLTDFWLEGKDSKYSVIAPRRLFEKAKDHFHLDYYNTTSTA